MFSDRLNSRYPPRAGRAAASSLEALTHNVGRLVVPEMLDPDDQAPVGPGRRQEVGRHSQTLCLRRRGQPVCLGHQVYPSSSPCSWETPLCREISCPFKDGVQVEQTCVLPGRSACDCSFLAVGERLPRRRARQYAITEDARPVGTAPRVPAVVMEHDDHDRYHVDCTYLNDIDGASAHGPISSHSDLSASCCSVRTIPEDNEITRRRSGGLGHPLRPYRDMDTENKVKSLQHPESMLSTGTYSSKLNVAQLELDVDDEEQEHLIRRDLARRLELKSKLELEISQLQEDLYKRELKKGPRPRELLKSSTLLVKDSNEDNDMSQESMIEHDLMDVQPSAATDAMPCRGTAPVPELKLMSHSEKEDDHRTSNHWSLKRVSLMTMMTGTPMRTLCMKMGHWTRKKSRLKEKRYIQKSTKLKNEFTSSEESERFTLPMVPDPENEAQELYSKHNTSIVDSHYSCSPSRRIAPALVTPDWLVPRERLPPVLVTEDKVILSSTLKESMTKLVWKRSVCQRYSLPLTSTTPHDPFGFSNLLKNLSKKYGVSNWYNEPRADGEDLCTDANGSIPPYPIVQTDDRLPRIPVGAATPSLRPSKTSLNDVCGGKAHTRKQSMTHELYGPLSLQLSPRKMEISTCRSTLLAPIRVPDQLQIRSGINLEIVFEAMLVLTAKAFNHDRSILLLIAPRILEILDVSRTYVMVLVRDQTHVLSISGEKPNKYDGNTIEVTDRRSLSCLKVHSLLSWAFPAMDQIPNDNGIGVDQNAAGTNTLVMTLESDLIVHVRNIRIHNSYESNPYLWMVEIIQLFSDLLMLSKDPLQSSAELMNMNLNDIMFIWQRKLGIPDNFPSDDYAANSLDLFNNGCAMEMYHISASLKSFKVVNVHSKVTSLRSQERTMIRYEPDMSSSCVVHNDKDNEDYYSKIYEFISLYEEPESEIYSSGSKIDCRILLLYVDPISECRLEKMILFEYLIYTNLPKARFKDLMFISIEYIQIRNEKELTVCGRRHIVDLAEPINRWNPLVTWALNWWPLTHCLMLKIHVSEDIRTRSQPQLDPVAWKEKKRSTLVSKVDPMLKNGWRLDPHLRAPPVAGIMLIIICEFASVDDAMSLDIEEVLTLNVVDHAHNLAEPTDGWKIPFASVVCRWPRTRLQSCKSNVMLDRRLTLQPQFNTPWYGRQLVKIFIKSFGTLCRLREDNLNRRLEWLGIEPCTYSSNTYHVLDCPELDTTSLLSSPCEGTSYDLERLLIDPRAGYHRDEMQRLTACATIGELYVRLLKIVEVEDPASSFPALDHFTHSVRRRSPERQEHYLLVEFIDLDDREMKLRLNITTTVEQSVKCYGKRIGTRQKSIYVMTCDFLKLLLVAEEVRPIPPIVVEVSLSKSVLARVQSLTLQSNDALTSALRLMHAAERLTVPVSLPDYSEIGHCEMFTRYLTPVRTCDSDQNDSDCEWRHHSLTHVARHEMAAEIEVPFTLRDDTESITDNRALRYQNSCQNSLLLIALLMAVKEASYTPCRSMDHDQENAKETDKLISSSFCYISRSAILDFERKSHLHPLPNASHSGLIVQGPAEVLDHTTISLIKARIVPCKDLISVRHPVTLTDQVCEATDILLEYFDHNERHLAHLEGLIYPNLRTDFASAVTSAELTIEPWIVSSVCAYGNGTVNLPEDKDKVVNDTIHARYDWRIDFEPDVRFNGPLEGFCQGRAVERNITNAVVGDPREPDLDLHLGALLVNCCTQSVIVSDTKVDKNGNHTHRLSEQIPLNCVFNRPTSDLENAGVIDIAFRCLTKPFEMLSLTKLVLIMLNVLLDNSTHDLSVGLECVENKSRTQITASVTIIELLDNLRDLHRILTSEILAAQTHSDNGIKTCERVRDQLVTRCNGHYLHEDCVLIDHGSKGWIFLNAILNAYLDSRNLECLNLRWRSLKIAYLCAVNYGAFLLKSPSVIQDCMTDPEGENVSFSAKQVVKHILNEYGRKTRTDSVEIGVIMTISHLEEELLTFSEVLTYSLDCFVLCTPQERKEGERVYQNSKHSPKPSTCDVETTMNIVVNSEKFKVDQLLLNVSRTLIALATTIDQQQCTLDLAVLRLRNESTQRLLTAISVLTENQWIGNGGREHNITSVPGNPQLTSVNKTNYACLEPELSPTCSIITKSRLPERTLTVVSVALNPFWRSSDQFDSGSRRARVWISTQVYTHHRSPTNNLGPIGSRLVQTTGIRTAYASTYWTWPAAIQSVCSLLDGQGQVSISSVIGLASTLLAPFRPYLLTSSLVTFTIPFSTLIPRRAPSTKPSITITIEIFDSTRGFTLTDGHRTNYANVIGAKSILERDHHSLLCRLPLLCTDSTLPAHDFDLARSDGYQLSNFIFESDMILRQPPLGTTTRTNDLNHIPEHCHWFKLHLPLTTCISSWFFTHLWPDLEIFGNRANSDLIHIFGDISPSTPNDVTCFMEHFPALMIDLYAHAEPLYSSIASSNICRSVAKFPNLPEHFIMPEQVKANIVDLICVDNPFRITVIVEIFEGFKHGDLNFDSMPDVSCIHAIFDYCPLNTRISFLENTHSPYPGNVYHSKPHFYQTNTFLHASFQAIQLITQSFILFQHLLFDRIPCLTSMTSALSSFLSNPTLSSLFKPPCTVPYDGWRAYVAVA